MNKSKKIVIGIVSKHYPEEYYKNRKVDTYVRDEVKQAIFDNGGIAIGILPTEMQIEYSGDEWKDILSIEEKENLIAQLELCDGIILQGGRATENYENIVAKYCYDNDVPMLGICAGQNGIARALGGTTYEIPNPSEHDKSFDEYVHSIKIDENSKFYNIVKTNKIMVNSRHKRTIKDCPMLDKVAFCEDGYPDVIEAKNKTFYLGVRFHPESLYKKDENMKNIFKIFIEICKKFNARNITNNDVITKQDLENKYVFWDIDGTLAPYRFNGHISDPQGTNNGMSLEEVEQGVFLQRKPSLFMQKVLNECKPKKNIIMGHCQNQKEIDDKQIWLDKYYPMIKERLLVFQDTSKADCIIEYCKEQKIDLKDVIYIDDVIKFLREAERKGIKSWHISSFLDWQFYN